MKPTVAPLRRLLVVTALLAAVATRAEMAKLGTDSPFMASGQTGTTVQVDQGAPEFKGILNIGGNLRFNIAPAGGKGTWLGLNEAGSDFKVVEYQKTGDVDAVTIEHQGHRIRLELAKPKTAKAAPMAVARPGLPGQAQGPITPVVLNPTPADQARGLEDTIAEVRRRRLQRQQDALKTPAGQPAPGSSPSPAPPNPVRQ